MIKLSTRVLYGLRAVIYIGLNKDRWPISLSEVAENQNIPLRYIEQIFIKFKRSGIVKSVRGVKGGYVLRDGYENITLLEIVESADSKIVPVWCLNSAYKKKCPVVKNCMLVEIWNDLGSVIRNYLENISLKDLLLKAKETDFIKIIEKSSIGENF
ncbi:MAG: Rrf2 family transcriptional regulator [Brevinematia bacterium]